MAVGVYTHSRPDGTVFYVGKGSERRSRDLESRQRNRLHVRIVAKDGRENIKIEFFPCASEDEAFAEEKRLIAHYRSIGMAIANIASGGEGQSYPKSEEHKEKIRRTLTGRKVPREIVEKTRATLNKPEVKERQRLAMKAAWQRQEIREKMLAAFHSEAWMTAHRNQKKSARKTAVLIERNKNPEFIAKVKAALKGRKKSPEHLAKMRLNSAKLKGTKLKPEILSKMIAAKAKRAVIICKQCGKEALRLPEKAKYCSFNCSRKAWRARRKKEHGIPCVSIKFSGHHI